MSIVVEILDLVHLLVSVLILVTLLIIAIALRDRDLFQIKVLIRSRVRITNEVQLQLVVPRLLQIQTNLCRHSALDCDFLDTVQCL